ncbi:MAG TPA: ATP-binding protein [Myxococcales bacterium]
MSDEVDDVDGVDRVDDVDDRGSDDQEEEEESSGLPEWFEQGILAPFEAGVASVFLLHGDVHGLVANPDAEEEPEKAFLPLRAFLERIFDSAELVAFYDVAAGIGCLKPAMEKRLLDLTRPAAERYVSSDPVAAARQSLAAKRGLPKEPEAALPILENALKAMKRVAVVIESAHFVAPTISAGIPLPAVERATVQRIVNWARDGQVRERRNMVLLVTDQAAKVNGELRVADCGIPVVFIPKPAQDERVAFLMARMDDEVPEGFDVQAFARASQGMSLRQLQEVLSKAEEAGEELGPEFVKGRKKEILNAEYGDVMEVVDPVRGLDDIGGNAHIKAYFAQVLEAIRKGDSRLVPMGVTLMGPPGTGKSAIVEALAKEAGFNFVKTRNVRSMWVGESEARMEKLLNGLRSLAPVVVMNDEADLAEAGRDGPKGDSGVSERLMKMWMELLADPRIRGQILVINCTNRPDRIDPALKRSGRSDERILMPLPSSSERAAILALMFKRHAIAHDLQDFAPYADATEGQSGADLEKVVLGAWRVAREKGRAAVDGHCLSASIADFIPSASRAEIDAMTIAGLAECSSKRLLPPEVEEMVLGIRERGLVKDLDEIVSRLAERGIVAPEDFRPKATGQSRLN